MHGDAGPLQQTSVGGRAGLLAAVAAFCPAESTLKVQANNTLKRVPLGEASHLLLTNAGGNIAFIKLGGAGVAVDETAMPLLPGSAQVIGRGSATHMSITCPLGGDVYITEGEGV